MSSRLVWDGLDDFREALRNLPAALVGEASNIVESNANAAAFDIRSAYGAHRYTGNLQEHVVVEHKSRGFMASALVRATAKHAHLFEFGTQARHTTLGSPRGSMPPGNIFIPRVRQWRRRMYAELKAMLERHGLIASGEAEAA